MVLRYRYWEYAAAYKICEYHLRSRAFILMHHDSHYTPSCMTFGLNLLCQGALGNLTIKTNDAVVVMTWSDFMASIVVPSNRSRIKRSSVFRETFCPLKVSSCYFTLPYIRQSINVRTRKSSTPSNILLSVIP